MSSFMPPVVAVVAPLWCRSSRSGRWRRRRRWCRGGGGRRAGGRHGGALRLPRAPVPGRALGARLAWPCRRRWWRCWSAGCPGWRCAAVAYVPLPASPHPWIAATVTRVPRLVCQRWWVNYASPDESRNPRSRQARAKGQGWRGSDCRRTAGPAGRRVGAGWPTALTNGFMRGDRGWIPRWAIDALEHHEVVELPVQDRPRRQHVELVEVVDPHAAAAQPVATSRPQDAQCADPVVSSTPIASRSSSSGWAAAVEAQHHRSGRPRRSRSAVICCT